LSHMPAGLDTFLYHNGGAEAVENAIKLARHVTKKQNVIAFQGGFHGRSFGTMALTTSKTIYRAGYGPLMPGAFITPFPYCSHCPVSNANKKYNSSNCCKSYEEELALLLKQQTAPTDTAAILVEPILGEGGYVVPPKDFLAHLRKVCTENNILLILDEVQTGFCRTGKWFAYEHFGIVPDILVMAKGIASGFPLAAVAAPRELMNKQSPGSMGGTFAGNAVSCAAAIATLEIMEDTHFLENVNSQSHTIMQELFKMKADPANQIVDVRGLGLMIGIEFASRKGLANAIAQQCLNGGLLVLSTGIYETLRFMPPLTIGTNEAEKALSILKTAINQALKATSK